MANLTITVARKPLTGTVAKNALQWGTGGINIDESRIASGGEHMRGLVEGRNVAMTPGDDRQGKALGMFQPGRGFIPTDHPGGRWPSNVLLVHKAGCRLIGTKQVPGISGTAAGKMAGKSTEVYGTFLGSERAGEPTGYADEDGLETVDAWECVEGCPVTELDRQTGLRAPGHYPAARPEGSDRSGPTGHSGQEGLAESYLAPGGVARFFKQFPSAEGEGDAE